MSEPRTPETAREARAIISNRGTAALERGDLREAIRQYTLVVKLTKRDSTSVVELHQALYTLGITCRDAGYERKSIRHLKKAAKLGSRRAMGALNELQ